MEQDSSWFESTLHVCAFLENKKKDAISLCNMLRRVLTLKVPVTKKIHEQAGGIFDF